jgi:DNA-binding GntR family transcriptional regulator
LRAREKDLPYPDGGAIIVSTVITVLTDVVKTRMAAMSGVSSCEKAHRNILEAILDNRLQVGVFLSQRKLAEIAGMSIISAREALKQLQHEYYLEHVPRWGYRIPLETRNLIIERSALREAIEVMVAYILARMEDKPFAQELFRRAEECDLIRTDDADSIQDGQADPG